MQEQPVLASDSFFQKKGNTACGWHEAVGNPDSSFLCFCSQALWGYLIRKWRREKLVRDFKDAEKSGCSPKRSAQ